jgi:hypothetical protein
MVCNSEWAHHGEPPPMVRSLTRKKFVSAGGAAAAAAAGGAGIGLLGGIASARTAPSPEQDRRILTFLLGLQRIEHAFYAQARRAGRLRGEVGEFVAAAGTDERRHVEALESALGGAATPGAAIGFSVGDAFGSPAAFAAKAAALEDAVVAACNGQATNLTPERLTQVFSIVSVEARQAAWIRDLGGMEPAAEATDAPQDADAIRATLRKEGLIT